MISPHTELPLLDWPWSRLADALVRYAQAAERLQIAQTAGDANAALLERLDLDSAQVDYHRCREKIAELWLMGLRIALDLHPVETATLVAGLVRHIPVQPVVAQSIEAIEERLDQAERRILKIAGVE